MNEVPINVEPSLFEWCTWHKKPRHTAYEWLTREELIESNFNINLGYSPQLTNEEMVSHWGDVDDIFLDKNGLFLEAIAEEADGENILLVGHASTVEVAYQKLVRTKRRTSMGQHLLMHDIPYCSFIGLEKMWVNSNKWRFIENGPFSVTQSENGTFDKNILSR